jgi:cyclic beta-1,2-glucan synthetase
MDLFKPARYNMNGSKIVEDFLSEVRSFFQGHNPEFRKYVNEEPLRAELFSSDQMDHYSRSLAASHKLSKKRYTDRLLKRLADNERVLSEVRHLMTRSIKENYQITPAGEWLLDNFYLIEEQIHTAKRHLPKVYSEGLPQLAEGTSAGLPRVYDIVLELIAHSDGLIDMEGVNHFLTSYSSITQLQLGELWAVPIMLRLALIENLRRVSSRIAIDRIQKNLADYWAKELIETAENRPRDLILVVADMARSNPPLERAFVSELTRQLRGRGPNLAQTLVWIEERLIESGQTSNELIQSENQTQAADQVSVSNSIGSLRLLGTMDWRGFVETHSVVETILRRDPIYPHINFSTRDHYRHVIEAISKKSELSEAEIAILAIRLASENLLKGNADDPSAHVGFYLIGKGRPQTEHLAKMKVPIINKVRRGCGRVALPIYLSAVLVISASITLGMVLKAYFSTGHYWVAIVVGVLSFIAASQLAVTLVNFISSLLVRPDLLPRMDYSMGIPSGSATFVVVPSMLSSREAIDDLVEALEVRFLSNKEENLYFALLTDLKDAPEMDMPEDQHLINYAEQKINELRQKYIAERSDIFYLFHRPRLWNARERKWMGYERKRGKLADLNGLLRGNSKNHFSHIIGDVSALPRIKYVITLDADTQLPRDSARKIIAAMAHVLNRAVYDEKKKRITEGYGILQPRVSVSLPGMDSSLYARMNGNEPALDPYTRATSDIYQDLFQEGSFIGKGIYDVDIFEKVLGGRFPENRILSHDLLEGCYVRSGLLSDVQLYEKYPSRYIADMKRRHRWIRGDWQIYPWFTPFTPGADHRLHRNPLSALSRWKIFDNIRRSLVPPALTVLIIFCWLLLPQAGIWTLMVTGIIILPAAIRSIWELMRKPRDTIFLHHLVMTGRSAGNAAASTLFTAICLPYEAVISVDAILRTVWRMLLSRRNLLEWDHSLSAHYKEYKDMIASYGSMLAEPLSAVILFDVLLYISPVRLLAALPILLLWGAAPFITWLVSRPLANKAEKLTARQNIFLLKLARKTWAFFDSFVTADDNWLPPDNYQEGNAEMLAHRTSPTNIGLYMLANLSAYDFGFITSSQFLERTRLTMATLQKMERYKGHFYNWYDTQTLHPLAPRYVSSVDSGNLAAYLLTLRQGMLQMPNLKIIQPAFFQGLRDTLQIWIDGTDKGHAAPLQYLKRDLENYCISQPDSLNMFNDCLTDLANKYAAAMASYSEKPEGAVNYWQQAFAAQLQAARNDLNTLTPWLQLPTMPDRFKAVLDMSIPTFHELSVIDTSIEADIARLRASGNTTIETEWLTSFESAISEAAKQVAQRMALIEELTTQCNEMADIEWDFLYDRAKNLLTIGYNADDHRCDTGYYDLLASEARLSAFVGIAQDKLPQESWFALSRLLTNVEGRPILLSWSGSMFEYLMPLLVMPTFANTLLDQTNRSAVEWQIAYGKQRGVSWGISESGYNMIDAAQNYQYRAFGAPGLGLKRGLGEDLVIAPYASMLALMVMPEEACRNLQALSEEGFEGKYGLYEAIDYTPSRLSRGQTYAIVQSYMAHHQGMGLLSLAYILLDQPMQKRFEMEPRFQAALILLEERIPKAISVYAHTTDIADFHSAPAEAEVRVIHTPTTPIPEVKLFSNGRYHVMITNSGSGYSRWKDITVTRWREDVTCDNWGTFCYIRDVGNKTFWSAAYQPSLKKSNSYEAAFAQGRADFRSTNNDIETHTEIVVSPEDDIEMRRFTLTNQSDVRRTLDVTSYAEVVIAPAAADAAHATFSDLFVQTEIVPQQNAIICTRRPRSAEEKTPWMFHLMKVHDQGIEDISYETSRMKFIGHGNTIANPDAIRTPGPLSGSQGPVLDPIVAIRYVVTLGPGQSVVVNMITGMAETRDICQNLIEKYQDKHHQDRVFEMAWTHNQVVLRQINANEAEAQLYSRIAGSVIFTNPVLRGDPSVLIQNRRGQSGLWPYSISGDLPIVLLRVEEDTSINLVRQMVQMHSFWRMKGLATDLVILNESHGGYRQILQNQISDLVAAQPADQRGAIYVRSADQISNEDRMLFQTVARVIIAGSRGTLADHINRRQPVRNMAPLIKYMPPDRLTITPIVPSEDLVFFNGIGGFAPGGSEYVIVINGKRLPPAPWVNVLANPDFGAIISECGQSYTWSENAHEFRLTPWGNDPVSDTGGEVFYLRDEDNGYFWSPTPLPRGGQSGYKVRQGFGYSVFEHTEAGIHSEMWVYVDIQEAIKFVVLKVKNVSGAARKLSATGYVEWVLGELRQKSAMYIVTEMDSDTGALLAKNPYSAEFADCMAFFDVDDSQRTFTTDRNEFIGRNGTLRNPEAMSRTRLSGRLGAGLDPCAAIQVSFDLFDGQEREVIFKLGAGKNFDEMRKVAKQFKGAHQAHQALDNVKAYWAKTTGGLQIETPDPATNIMANGWLIYQTLACRLWARSGFYQSSGAFGFRDQLQDVMALMHIEPALARQQILLCASRQYKQGDVQHWWHPPIGRGVRTRMSDDFLWLPYVVCRYISMTGDSAILDAPVHFIEGRLLNPGEESYYELPVISSESATIYDHCVRAIKNGLQFGAHGLPLMGTGDWNDGMDRVGRYGKGESVWLAFFLYDILNRFKELAILRGDLDFEMQCDREAITLKENIDKNAWDGSWYRRAYFDDGTPLGSRENAECQIDSIAQSWPVLSGAGDPAKTSVAMDSAERWLVDNDNALIKLLHPPFDKSAIDPGYIKGYVPGVRENGGQYTHSAIWLIMALAKLKNAKRAWELLAMINPVNHGRTASEVAVYKVEPYVMAGDVYAVAPHTGRGGWSWYTGSAGWMYTLITESLLGIKVRGDKLCIGPCLPPEWTYITANYRYGNTQYHITMTQKHGQGETHISLDGAVQSGNSIPLTDDGRKHEVAINIFRHS